MDKLPTLARIHSLMPSVGNVPTTVTPRRRSVCYRKSVGGTNFTPTPFLYISSLVSKPSSFHLPRVHHHPPLPCCPRSRTPARAHAAHPRRPVAFAYASSPRARPHVPHPHPPLSPSPLSFRAFVYGHTPRACTRRRGRVQIALGSTHAPAVRGRARRVLSHLPPHLPLPTLPLIFAVLAYVTAAPLRRVESSAGAAPSAVTHCVTCRVPALVSISLIVPPHPRREQRTAVYPRRRVESNRTRRRHGCARACRVRACASSPRPPSTPCTLCASVSSPHVHRPSLRTARNSFLCAALGIWAAHLGSTIPFSGHLLSSPSPPLPSPPLLLSNSVHLHRMSLRTF
ncbi:hypothetical protein B0H16DRAFT_1893913 [Mycena metata]|uniref:Uncharacterized protein n=1 Tax=Mycena metata TaxID=1033252 RepID=A0AAD7HX93_9AGAR|nr:hypothetical protein B0H16DRAFT_1893913 [Mycena metata]